MKIEDVMEYFGSEEEIERNLNIPKEVVKMWVYGDRIPELKQTQLKCIMTYDHKYIGSDRMTIENVKEYFGSEKNISIALNVSRQAVNMWIKRGNIPMLRQYEIERITKGKLKRNSS